MSDISRNARKYAEEFEKNAENDQKQARELKEKILKTSEVAKSSIELQRTITEQLKAKIIPEFNKEKQKLEAIKKLTDESLQKANAVYDESLTLFATIDGLQIPKLNLEPYKEDASGLSESATNLKAELDELLDNNNAMLINLDENIDLSEIMIER
jgi:laminin, gamma 1